MVKKITPILYVDSIEPCLPFWEALGFERTAEVPHDGALGFVILAGDGHEVMYQTRASVESDLPSLAATPMRGSIVFLEIDDLDGVEKALGAYEVVVPRRRTFYGADELWYREPAGNMVGFAQFGG